MCQKCHAVLGIWKLSCLMCGASALTVVMYSGVWSCSWDGVLTSAVISRQTHIPLRGHRLACPLTWSCSTWLSPVGICQKWCPWNLSCQYWWCEHILPILMTWNSKLGSVKSKGVLWQAKVAQGVPGRLRPQIF